MINFLFTLCHWFSLIYGWLCWIFGVSLLRPLFFFICSQGRFILEAAFCAAVPAWCSMMDRQVLDGKWRPPTSPWSWEGTEGDKRGWNRVLCKRMLSLWGRNVQVPWCHHHDDEMTWFHWRSRTSKLECLYSNSVMYTVSLYFYISLRYLYIILIILLTFTTMSGKSQAPQMRLYGALFALLQEIRRSFETSQTS